MSLLFSDACSFVFRLKQMLLEINVMYNFTLTVYPELSIAVRNVPLAFLHDASAALDPLLLVREFALIFPHASEVLHTNRSGGSLAERSSNQTKVLRRERNHYLKHAAEKSLEKVQV